MKIFMKKLSALVLASALTAILIGCGSTGGYKSTKVSMQPGSYTAKAFGYSMGEPIEVTVTVTKNKITDIYVNPDNAETEPVFNAALAVADRIIEKQALNVDGVTGATFSSSAIRRAAQSAVEQALVAGGSDASAVEAFMKAKNKTVKNVELKTDVVIVGMGAAGLSTMTRTAELLKQQGKAVNIIAIDKNGYYGGNSLMASDFFGVNPKKHTEKYNGGKDYMDANVMRRIWMNYTEGDAKESMINLYIDRSGQVLDWLEFEHDYQFAEEATGGFSGEDKYAGRIQFLPNDNGAINKPALYRYFTGLVNNFTKNGGKYMLETEAYALLLDDKGSVAGIKARNKLDGIEYVIHATQVVLATGGFADSGEMTEKYLSDKYYPLKGAWNHLTVNASDGKMIQAAIDNGAGTYNIGVTPSVHLTGAYRQISGFDTHVVKDKIGTITDRTAIWSENDVPKYMVISPYSIAVNKFGKRFATEERIGFLDSWKAGPTFYSIWSQAQIDEIRTSGFDSASLTGPSIAWLGYRDAVPSDRLTSRKHMMALPMPDRYVTCMPDHTPIAAIDDIMQAGIKAGFIYKANSIRELATTLGIDPATLTQTINTFNGYCASGVDSEFNKTKKYLRALDANGPYYAVTGSAYCYSSCGGLDVNEKLQVLDTNGKVINGLFAVGNDSSGVLYTEKKAYVTYGGVAQGWAYTSGYVASETVSNNVK